MLNLRSKRGFTLIELAITLAVVACLMTVVVMGAGFFEASRQQAAFQDVDTLRQAARNWAITHCNSVDFQCAGPTGTTIGARLGTGPTDIKTLAGMSSPWNTRVGLQPEALASCAGGLPCVRVCVQLKDAQAQSQKSCQQMCNLLRPGACGTTQGGTTGYPTGAPNGSAGAIGNGMSGILSAACSSSATACSGMGGTSAWTLVVTTR